MRYDTAVPEQNDLLNFIATTVETLRDQMATKDDLANLEKRMATRNNLDQLELRMDAKMTAIRGDIEQVQVRLDSIDHAVSARLGTVETEISRMRSVVYLLVKDQPDMLRLLGQPWPGENRPQS